MFKKSKYFHFSNQGEVHILDNQMELNWMEILLYPIPLFVVFYILTRVWLIALMLSVLFGLLYSLFRFAAWFYYTEIIFDLDLGVLIRVKKFFGKERSSDTITNELNIDRFGYKKVGRGGMTKYVLQYSTHKTIDLLIIKSIKDKLLIEAYLYELKSGANKRQNRINNAV